jgi:pyruvate/2-oxoglutarate dehydrogenase complex dihydrolipoamide dehydrogenase (E3) component
VPSIPPFGGNSGQNALTRELLFEQDALSESLVIMGGGPIGVELAQMLATLGVKCTIIEMLDTILSGIVEPEFVDLLTQKLSGAQTLPGNGKKSRKPELSFPAENTMRVSGCGKYSIPRHGERKDMDAISTYKDPS